MPTFSQALEQSLHRSLAIANERHHQYATLEHLLLSLIDDADAIDVLEACKCDRSKLRSDLINYIETEFENLVTDGEDDAKPTAGFQRSIQRAVIQVQNDGFEEVSGADILVGISAERASHAWYLLQQQGIKRDQVKGYAFSRNTSKNRADPTRHLPTLIEDSLEVISESGPDFKAVRGKIRYRQSSASGRLAERKDAVVIRSGELQRLCTPRANEQPELKKIADRYAVALKKLRRDRGAYSLFILGLELELLLKTKAELPSDTERNPRIDGDLLFAARSLIIAHAGLVTLFPDVKRASKELDQYRQLGETVDAFKDRLLDPAIEELASSQGIFDENTQTITREIKELSDQEKEAGHPPSEGTTAIKHSWLRGAFASLGRYLIKQTKEGTKIARDSAIREETAAILKNRDHLASAILKFLESSKETLSALAEKLPSSFGWIGFLLSLLGLK